MAWTNILDIIYPVGSIYISTVNISPASTVGGNWTQITDRFILAGESPTTTGGNTEHSHSLSGAGGALIDVLASGNWINIATTSNAVPFSPASRHAFQTNSYNLSVETDWHQVSLTGSTDINNNVPPYYTVCMWVRTA